MEADSTSLLSRRGCAADRGVKPRSFISRNATTNISRRIATRRRNGTPSDVTWAMTPPSTEPPSIAAPDTICPRPSTVSRCPWKPVAVRASTSQASTAPEKKVKPRPISTETTAQAQNGEPVCHINQ